MNSVKTSSVIKKSILLIIPFVALFGFRLWYGYQYVSIPVHNSNELLHQSWGEVRNIASNKYKKGQSIDIQSVKIDQKYEKTATVSSSTSRFGEDETKARGLFKDHKALIQFETKSGNKGYRTLNMAIGVPPDSFDYLYQELTKIGKISAKTIVKKDKTNEYKKLNARKASLEKMRSSLIDLKAVGGKINEHISLEDRILDIEQQLQGLGVQLGDFDEENEFCTIKFSLREQIKRSISTLHRFKVAFQWAVKWYCGLLLMGCLMMGFTFLTLKVTQKLGALNIFKSTPHSNN